MEVLDRSRFPFERGLRKLARDRQAGFELAQSLRGISVVPCRQRTAASWDKDAGACLLDRGRSAAVCRASSGVPCLTDQPQLTATDDEHSTLLPSGAWTVANVEILEKLCERATA